jgi:hypothetical protein
MNLPESSSILPRTLSISTGQLLANGLSMLVVYYLSSGVSTAGSSEQARTAMRIQTHKR